MDGIAKGLRLRQGLLLYAVFCAALLPAAVPDPASHFGHAIGVDKELLDWDKVVSYFYLLAKNSDKIQVKEIGKTAEGRPMIAATSRSLHQLVLDLAHIAQGGEELVRPERLDHIAVGAEVERFEHVHLVVGGR